MLGGGRRSELGREEGGERMREGGKRKKGRKGDGEGRQEAGG